MEDFVRVLESLGYRNAKSVEEQVNIARRAYIYWAIDLLSQGDDEAVRLFKRYVTSYIPTKVLFAVAEEMGVPVAISVTDSSVYLNRQGIAAIGYKGTEIVAQIAFAYGWSDIVKIANNLLSQLPRLKSGLPRLEFCEKNENLRAEKEVC